jgi:hypothetical protein
MIAAGIAFVVALAGMTFLPVTVQAEERTCRGSIGSTTVDNLRVPDGATCTLRGTFVKGTIKVETNAVLHAHNVRVIGNVQGENARAVNLYAGSRVGGSVQVKQGYSAKVLGTHVNGDIQFDENDGPLTANDNRVGGSIQVVKNFGGVAINRNVVDGNLQCKENSPPPTGGNNIVHGNKEDQCARL